MLPFRIFCRGDLVHDFFPGTHNVQQHFTLIRLEEYNMWCISRQVIPIYSNSEAKTISSFIEIKNLLSDKSATLTTCAFTSILLYLLTQFYTVYTWVQNFQDMLKQRELPYDALWCDPGVYRISKEIKLLKSNKFDNVFLGMGGFHTEQTVLASIGKFLEGSGTEKTLFQAKDFGPVR